MAAVWLMYAEPQHVDKLREALMLPALRRLCNEPPKALDDGLDDDTTAMASALPPNGTAAAFLRDTVTTTPFPCDSVTPLPPPTDMVALPLHTGLTVSASHSAAATALAPRPATATA